MANFYPNVGTTATQHLLVLPYLESPATVRLTAPAMRLDG